MTVNQLGEAVDGQHGPRFPGYMGDGEQSCARVNCSLELGQEGLFVFVLVQRHHAHFEVEAPGGGIDGQEPAGVLPGVGDDLVAGPVLNAPGRDVHAVGGVMRQRDFVRVTPQNACESASQGRPKRLA